MPKRSGETAAASALSRAQAFARALGIKKAPALVQFSVRFRAPRQGNYQPPDYELTIDSTREDWCTYRNYNLAPRPIEPTMVMVPVEMTLFKVLKLSRGLERAKIEAWARSLLSRG